MLIDNFLLPIRFGQTINRKHPFQFPTVRKLPKMKKIQEIFLKIPIKQDNAPIKSNVLSQIRNASDEDTTHHPSRLVPDKRRFLHMLHKAQCSLLH
ncbi:hypothetical protein BACPLE_01840 [Phocaeicola plebeius DSM 17135]|uniref:Uncharacterized protein n=1 Tax=Phocaeicola plebeius (strain DSM 17135 / JCM 12973 / CCUG 54634 / M2) TaxID=484018 RepID=B5CYN6_PHOPM|nr:hypothetical protein BACPLE_01840 [Phocaeicola plebeius DSM 17135]